MRASLRVYIRASWFLPTGSQCAGVYQRGTGKESYGLRSP